MLGRHMNVACSPWRLAVCLTALRNSTIRSAAARPAPGWKVASTWLGPNSTSSERSGSPSSRMFLRMISSAGSSSSARCSVRYWKPWASSVTSGGAPGCVASSGREPGVLDREEMELDLEAGDEVVAPLGEPVDRLAAYAPGRERHRRAVRKVDVAQHPSGRRRPGEDPEGAGIGDHHEIAGAGHLAHSEAAALGEHRIDRPVRRVLGKERRGHRAAVAHGARDLARDQGLAAEDAVLVGEGQAHDVEPAALDLLERLGAPEMVVVAPEPVFLHQRRAARGARAHSGGAHGERPRRVASAARHASSQPSAGATVSIAAGPRSAPWAPSVIGGRAPSSRPPMAPRSFRR